jgi:hypothetical protein
MKFIPTLDIHKYGQAVRDGQIILQSGQWVACGEEGFAKGRKSRFHSVRPSGSIVAFHGPLASAKYMIYVLGQRIAEQERQERRELRKFLREMA